MLSNDKLCGAGHLRTFDLFDRHAKRGEAQFHSQPVDSILINQGFVSILPAHLKKAEKWTKL